MRKIIFFLSLFIGFSASFSQTGSPQLINYQGIARNTGGGVLSNATIDVQFNIRQGSAGGSVVFNETHSTVTTNNFGLFTLQIGSVSSLSSVAWGTNKFYLEVLVDAGSGFNPAGPPQELISTPYALYAQQTPPPVVSFTNNVLSVNGSTTAISTGANYGAGTGIAISGSVISNSAPNQTVNISSGNNTSVSGTYPNYTVDVPNSSINYNPATSVLGLTQGSNTSTTSIVIPPATPATSISAGSNVTVSGSAPSYTIDANPNLSLSGNLLSITGGNTVTLPTGTTYTPGTDISITSGSVINNTAPDQTVTISNGTNVNVSGAYPNFTVDATPNLNIAGNTLSITGGNSVTLPTPAPYTAGSDISIVGNVITNTSPDQTVTIIGNGATSVSGAYPNYTVSSTTQSLNLAGNTLSITGGNSVTLPTPAPYTAGPGISIAGNVITNTAQDQTVTITGGGATTVGGTYPNFTINTPAPVAPNIVVNSPHTTTTLSANNYSINVQPTNLTSTGVATVTGTYPSYNVNVPNPALSYTPLTGALQLTQGSVTSLVTIPPQVNATLTGAGTTTVATSGLSYTVGTPGVGMLYAPATGVLSYSPAPGTNTINLTPNVGFTGGILTVGSNTASIPGTGLWSPSGSTAVVTSNPANFVGIGTNNPQHLIHAESASGPVEVSLISQPTFASNLTFGIPTNHFLGNIRYNFTNNSMSFWTNNTADRLFIDASGNVGIKTNSPATDLHVFNPGSASSIKVSSGSSPIGLVIQSNNTSANLLNYDNTPMYFGTNGANRMTILNTGNVGIGTGGLSPGSLLGVYGNAAIGSAYAPTAAPVNGLIVQGNVGIGTSAPGYNLEVAGTGKISTALSTGYTGIIENTAGGGISGSAMRVTNSGSRSIGHDGMLIENLVTKSGGSNSTKIGLRVESTGSWGPGTVNQPNIGLQVNATGADNNYSGIFLGGGVGIGTANPVATSSLHVNGKVAITDGTQGTGKVLTSDGAGLGSWQPLPPPPPQIGFFAGNNPVTDQSIAANSITILSFGTGYAYFNDGGGYSTATNKFTPPSNGVYHVDAYINYSGVAGASITFWLRYGAGHILRYDATVPAGGTGTANLSCTYNTNVTSGPIWIEGWSPSAFTVKAYNSGFSAHKIY